MEYQKVDIGSPTLISHRDPKITVNDPQLLDDEEGSIMSEGHAGSVRSMKAIDDQKKKMLKNEKQEKLKNASEFELKEDENLKAEKVIIKPKTEEKPVEKNDFEKKELDLQEIKANPNPTDDKKDLEMGEILVINEKQDLEMGETLLKNGIQDLEMGKQDLEIGEITVEKKSLKEINEEIKEEEKEELEIEENEDKMASFPEIVLKKPQTLEIDTDIQHPTNPMVRMDIMSPTTVGVNKTETSPLLMSPAGMSPTSGMSRSPRHFVPMSPILKRKGKERKTAMSDSTDFKNNFVHLIEQKLNAEHPRNKDEEPYGFYETFFEVDTGYHCCGDTSKNNKDGLEKLGIGVTLYFKFLKYIICFFLLFGVLSMPSIYFSSTAVKKSTRYTLDSFTKSVFATTLGGIGFTNHICDMESFNNITNSYTSGLYIACDTGKIDVNSSNSFRYGLYIDATTDCNYADETFLDKTCIHQSEFEKYYKKNCDNQYCNISNLTSYLINSTDCQKKFLNYPFYLSSICKNTKIFLILGQKEYPLDSSLVALIVGLADGLIVISYLYMIRSLSKSEEKARDEVLLHSLSASNFSLEFSNLPKMDKEKILVQLKVHLEKVLNKFASSRGKIYDPISNSPQTFNVVDINIAEASDFIIADMNRSKYEKLRNNLVKNFLKKYDPNKQLKEPTILEIENFYHTIEDEKTFKAADKEFKNKIFTLEKKMVKWENVKIKSENRKKPNQKAVWVTFKTMRERDLAYKYLSSSIFDRFWYNLCKCCLKNDKSFDGKLMICSSAPDPGNIKWENFTLSSRNRFFRELFSLFVTLLILIIAFAIIVYIKNYKQSIMDNIPPDVDCNKFHNITETEVAEEYKSTIKTGKIGCYCQQQLNQGFSHLNTKFSEANNEAVCLYWFEMDSLYKGLPYAIIVVIIIINIILQTIFKSIIEFSSNQFYFIIKELTSFERHRYYSQELGSRVIKTFIAQFLNTGILLFVMNIKFEAGKNFDSSIQNLFKGRFQDISPLWFYEVGTVICMTMVINLATNPTTLFVTLLIKYISKLRDTKCTMDKNISKKSTLEERQKLYMGPEFLIELRYAQVLSTIFVCMMYSSGMPVLYFSTCVQLFIFYWIDKICVLKFYRKLKNIDEKLEIYTKNMLIFALVIHIIFGIWILGNSQIFNNSFTIPFIKDYQEKADSVMSDYNVDYSYAAIFQTRVLKTQSLLLDLLLILILVYFVYRVVKIFTIDKLEIFCAQCKTKFFYSTKNPDFAKINYFEAFTFDQIETEMTFKHIIKDELKKDPKETPEFKNYMAFIENQYRQLKKIWEEKIKNEEDSKDKKNKFIGLPSYDMKNNEVFQNYYDIDKMKSNLSNIRYEKSPQHKKKSFHLAEKTKKAI